MEKILTISIAAYNVERFIETALRPFAQETLRGLIEVFIIDDDGTDNTIAIAKKYSDSFSDIFFPVHKKNGGWGSTVNFGIEHATGKFFKVLDGDDFINSESLDAFIRYLESIDSDIVFSPLTAFEDGTGKVLSRIVAPSHFEMGRIYQYEQYAETIPLALHCCTFKTSFLKKNMLHITEKCFYTDIEFVIKSSAVANSIAFFCNDIYEYRFARVGQSMSYQGLQRHYKDHLLITKKLIDFIKNNPITPNKNKAIYKTINYLINYQYVIFFSLSPTSEHKSELIQFDKYIHDYVPQHYNNVSLFYVKVARKFRFTGYSLIVAFRYLIHLMKKK